MLDVLLCCEFSTSLLVCKNLKVFVKHKLRFYNSSLFPNYRRPWRKFANAIRFTTPKISDVQKTKEVFLRKCSFTYQINIRLPDITFLISSHFLLKVPGNPYHIGTATF